MATPHDALFKYVFQQPEHAEGELRHVLPRAVTERIDWNTLQLEEGSFVDDELRERHADLLYSVQLAGQPALVYVLLEHKSESDPRTPLQMLVYITRIWQRFRDEHPDARKLPPIVPVVVHHSASGWTGGTNLLDLVDIDGELRTVLGRHLPSFELVLHDLAQESEEALRERAASALGRLALFCLKRARHSGDLLGELYRWTRAVREVRGAPNGADALGAVLWYILKFQNPPRAALRRFLRKAIGPRAEETMKSYADEIGQEYLEKGRAKGRAEGRAEALEKLLGARFGEVPAAVGERVRRASIDQLDCWLDRVLTANSLEEVFLSE